MLEWRVGALALVRTTQADRVRIGDIFDAERLRDVSRGCLAIVFGLHGQQHVAARMLGVDMAAVAVDDEQRRHVYGHDQADRQRRETAEKRIERVFHRDALSSPSLASPPSPTSPPSPGTNI